MMTEYGLLTKVNCRGEVGVILGRSGLAGCPTHNKIEYTYSVGILANGRDIRAVPACHTDLTRVE